MEKTRKLFYYFTGETINGGNWSITDDEQKAKQLDPNYKVATLEDLNDLICATGEVFTEVVEVQEGVFTYANVLHVDSLNPEFSYTSGEYISQT